MLAHGCAHQYLVKADGFLLAQVSRYPAAPKAHPLHPGLQVVGALHHPPAACRATRTLKLAHVVYTKRGVVHGDLRHRTV